MKAAAVLAGACGVVVAGAWVAGRLPERGAKEMYELAARPVYRLDVERPVEFLQEHLPAALVKPQGRLFGDDADEAIALVRVCRADKTVEMEIELLSGVQMDVNEYYILLAGTPATLDDTYALALRLCDMAGVPNDRIVKWHKEKGYESPLGSAELQAGRDGEHRHEIEVRSSLELEGDKLWRVIYTLYFPGPEDAKTE